MTSLAITKKEDISAGRRPRGAERRHAVTGTLNVGIRIVTLAAKFLLTLFLVRTVGASVVGTYGLMVSSIGLGLTVLGLEFYQHTLRSIAGADPISQVRRLRDQAVFHGLIYLCAFPLFAALAAADVLPLSLLPWFLAILTMENIAQEMGRALITLGRSTAANVLLFFRGGAWVYALLMCSASGYVVTDLVPVWLGWGSGTCASVFIGVVALRDLPWGALKGVPIDRAWIRRGAIVSARLALSTAALVALPASGRFALKLFHDQAGVGIFTFLSTLASLVQTFVEASVTSVRYPEYLAAYHFGGAESAARERRLIARAMGRVTGLLVLGGALGGWLALPHLVSAQYSEHLVSFLVLLLAYATLVLGWLPQLRMFAEHRDNLILVASMGGLSVALVFHAVLVPHWGVMGAACATWFGTAALTGFRILLSRGRAPEAHNA